MHRHTCQAICPAISAAANSSETSEQRCQTSFQRFSASQLHGVVQGVRPASLQRVSSQDLAEFISRCIAPIQERPHARQLLKHPYFDSVRQNVGALKLGLCPLAPLGAPTADLVAACLSPPSSAAGDAQSAALPLSQASIFGILAFQTREFMHADSKRPWFIWTGTPAHAACDAPSQCSDAKQMSLRCGQVAPAGGCKHQMQMH